MNCTCGHPLDVHGPSPRTGKLCCFDLVKQPTYRDGDVIKPGVSCQCNDFTYDEGEQRD